MAPADTHVTALLVTATLAVASAVFMSAPVAGIAEGAVRAAAVSGRDQCSPRGVSGDEGAGTKGMLDAGPSNHLASLPEGSPPEGLYSFERGVSAVNIN